jgi:hypothetical protein
MTQTYWQTDGRSPHQESPRHLWNPNVEQRSDRTLQLNPTLSQCNQTQFLTSHHFNKHFNIIFSHTPKSLRLSFPSAFQTFKTVQVFLISGTNSRSKTEAVCLTYVREKAHKRLVRKLKERDLERTVCGCVDWIELALNRVQWRDLVSTLVKLWAP